MAGATLHDVRQVRESWTITMSGKHVMTPVDLWHAQVSSTLSMLSQYPPVKNMWRGHLTHTPALAIAHGSASAKQDTCRPILATIHATWTNRFVHSMHKDTVHKTRHQVCFCCLWALNGSPLWVGGWNPSPKHKNSFVLFLVFTLFIFKAPNYVLAPTLTETSEKYTRYTVVL